MDAAAPRVILLHITDIHFWEVVLNPLRLLNKRLLGNANVLLRRRHHYHTERAHEFADALAATGAPSVFAGGDFTSTATDREFAQAAAFLADLEGRGLKVIAAPGNHDVYTFEAVRRKRFEQYLSAYMPESGYPARITLPGGTAMVIAPTVAPNLISSRGYIGGADIARVAELTAQAPPGPVIVAAHYPLLPGTATYHSSPGRRLRNAGRLRQALGETGRTLIYIAGHVHRFSLVRDTTWNNMLHLCTAAFVMGRKPGAQQGAFSEIHVLEEGFRVFRHEYWDGWRREEQHPMPDNAISC